MNIRMKLVHVVKLVIQTDIGLQATLKSVTNLCIICWTKNISLWHFYNFVAIYKILQLTYAV